MRSIMEHDGNINEKHPGILMAVLIWLILMVLTAATVLLHGVNLILPGVVVAIIIASAKSYLVITYFMHLKYENPALRRLVGMTFGILILILIFLFIDPLYR